VADVLIVVEHLIQRNFEQSNLTTLDCLIVGWQVYIVQASQNVLEKNQINLPPTSKPHVS
jgi:hypothetical protein